MSEHDKINLIRIQKALYKAIMNHPEAKQAGTEALARCRPLPPKSSDNYKRAQDVQIATFINAGKIPLLEAIQQDADATKGSGRQLKACRTAGLSV